MDFFINSFKKNSEFTIFYLGRQEFSEGWHIVTKLSEKFIKKGLNIKFISSGEDYGVIKGLGYIPERELPKIYSQSHITLLPRQKGVFPLSFLESLSCGTPIITSSLETHKMLDIPLYLSTNLNEYFKIIMFLYKKWSNDEKKYTDWANKFRDRISDYDKKVVLSIYRRSWQ